MAPHREPKGRPTAVIDRPPTHLPVPGTVEADRAERIARLRAARDDGSRGRRRAHPARGARVAALLASIAATGGIAAAMATADRSDDVVLDVAALTPTTTSASAESAAIPPSNPPSETDPSAGSSASAGVYPDGVWLGSTEYTKWGDVQVEVTIGNGAIVGVEAVQIPSDRKSASINNHATPILEAEAIASQDADLDIVSGATYTSRTYAVSLQAALDAAALDDSASAAQP